MPVGINNGIMAKEPQAHDEDGGLGGAVDLRAINGRIDSPL